ncbi:MAG: TadE/TadG family type IV pilus assembly protein [Pseudomonadota bacterium]
MILAIRSRIRHFPRTARRFVREPSGATAVEFGLIAVPFFFLKLAIIETALIFWAGSLLETGVADAGRLIRTGQVQENGITAEQFRQLVCQNAGALFDCGDRLAVDVQRALTFDAAELAAPPINGAGNYNGGFDWEPGAAEETIIVRAFYRWPVLFNFFGLDAADVPGRQRLLMATTAFRNEPFE